MSWRGKTYRPGDVIKAADENSACEEIARQARVSCGAGLAVRSGAITVVRPERIYLKLTSSANANGGYSWKEVLPAALGTWVDSGRTGSSSVDPAYERSKRDASLTSGATVYEAERAACTGEWIFE